MHRRSGIPVALILALALIATSGCDRRNDALSDVGVAAHERAAAIPQSEIDAADPAPIAQSTQAQRADLQAELATLQSQQAALQVERDRIARLVDSHQSEGTEKLAALKAQWSAVNAGSSAGPTQVLTREQFAERARVEMESVLMMDQEYRAQLEEADEKLRQTEEQMRELLEQAAL